MTTARLQIHNSLTGRKEPLRELVPGEIRMYVCGITVYDFLHIGHARMLIVFDTVQRYLRSRGYRVTYVRNITDIDDKIIDRARENGESIESLTSRFITAMDEDCAALGVARPDLEPRATQYVPQIVAMVERLVAGGYAYVAADGDVLYAVHRFADYGRLSGKRLADLRAGARVEVNDAKRDPLDFVLWKRAKPGEPAWESPWGPGRPGWHIECSAMSVSLLGPHFDLHGGGMDLKFPHHENEIAQSCAACGTPFVNLWMHNGFVRVDDEKMSKSLGNFFTVREVLPRLRPEVMRAFVLASHYRAPVNYSEDNLRQAELLLQRLYLALRGVEPAVGPVSGAATERFQAAMDDDFNTPEAIAVLQGLATELNSAKDGKGKRVAPEIAAELKALGALLGLAQCEPSEWLKSRGLEVTAAGSISVGGSATGAAVTRLADAEIDALVTARTEARQRKDWKESDRLRDVLAAQGVLLEDGPKGTSWRWK